MTKKRPSKGQIPKVRLSPEVRAALKALGSVGGKTTASKLSPEERRAKGQRAIKVRWEKYRARKAEQEKKKGKPS